MARSDQALRRVRRAYELAHVAAAARAMLVGIGLCLLALGLYRITTTTWLVASMLIAALAMFAWQGGAWRRGALAGVIAGLPPLIVPSIVFALSSTAGHCASCETTATWPCIVACFGSSSLVGLLVGHRAIADASPRRFAIGAIATAGLAGLLGCGTIGLGGALGVAIGMIAGGLTGWLVAARAVRA